VARRALIAYAGDLLAAGHGSATVLALFLARALSLSSSLI
jgi:hypothetical protein